MKRTRNLILLFLLVVSFASASLVYAGSGSTDRIAGVWSGNMNLTGVNYVNHIVVTIPAGCTEGGACGDILNQSVQCDWQMVFDGKSGGSYLYHFSKTLSGGCPAVGSGSFTLLSDGTLYRVHNNPDFTASGKLYKLPK
jgi:hypothetical protein